MNIKQIQIALRKSGMFSGFIRMGEDKLMFPSELGMYGTFTTLSLVGESGCMIKHPVIPYETPEQARVFLDECTKISVEHTHKWNFTTIRYPNVSWRFLHKYQE